MFVISTVLLPTGKMKGRASPGRSGLKIIRKLPGIGISPLE